jgi:hypothetical protein
MTPQEALLGLNKMRFDNGIPGQVRLSDTWSRACRLHDEHQTRNRQYGHFEQRSKPGYTTLGAWAAVNALIRIGDVPAEWQGYGPFADFPYHLFPLLAPQFAQTGFDARGNVACMIVKAPGAWRKWVPPANRIYTVPLDGATGVRPSFRDLYEFPFTPAKDAGLRSDATTGPNLFVYADGPWASCGLTWCGTITVVSARLAPAGENAKGVGVRWTRRSQYPYPSQILVPVVPLRPGTKYEASVTVRIGKVTRGYSWSFTTA